jgi:hypothetical protein
MIRKDELDCPHCEYTFTKSYIARRFDTTSSLNIVSGFCKGCTKRVTIRINTSGATKIYPLHNGYLDVGEDMDRDRGGYLKHRPNCPYCKQANDVNVIDKFFIKSGNKTGMNLTCEHCRQKVLVNRSKSGFYNLYPYTDYKKQRKIKSGWVQVRFPKQKENDTERICENH